MKKTVMVGLVLAGMGAAYMAAAQQDKTDVVEDNLLMRIRALTDEMQRQHPAALTDNLDRAILTLMDSNVVITDHNRRHPEDKWADSLDVLQKMCGACTSQFAEWRKQSTTGKY